MTLPYRRFMKPECQFVVSSVTVHSPACLVNKFEWLRAGACAPRQLQGARINIERIFVVGAAVAAQDRRSC
jgi:hypothetical protein